VRLVTLTGAGGSGKTRLAAEAAARAGSFTRVAWVDLASLADGALLAQRIATMMQIPERAGTPALDAIIEAVCGERVLVVLDNCEHLVRDCAELVDGLLRGCPMVRVLATSREALGVPGETAWLVPPMEQDEAVRLFAERAQSALPSFALAHRLEFGGRTRDLPPARRHSPRDRASRRAGPRALDGADRGATE
jgi:predicted ATPase